MKNDWISVKDRLPLEEYKSEVIGVFDEYLVTVMPKEPDEWDDPEVTLLYFSTTNGYFSRDLSTPTPYEEEGSWCVTHWMNKPEPAERK